ncbi:LacI family DNA-binding transcriptional regulator [Planococcus sp. 1R117A]|uniref:LacI family DNA-binding transcriptional regulator n=1 Tax=Planococcus sp. 1R117A TaxID=3447020 RepID=UPI003EDC010F
MVSTIAIAKYAGVSQTTVSRVLNKPDQVKKETYDKVMAAIAEYGYSAEPKEKMHKPKAVNTIRVLAAANDSVLFNGAMPSIVDGAAKQGLFVNIHLDGSVNKEALFDELVSEGTAGVIISAMVIEDRLVEKMNQSSIPFVLLNADHPNSSYSVCMNNAEAAYSAVSHLIETGHQEIAWVGGPLTSQTNKDGLLGAIHALQANKHKIRKKRLVITDTDKASLYEAFEKLQNLKKKPTAIVASTDKIAIRLMEFYQTAGRKVPEDISIIGLGNSEIGVHPAIGLTSVGVTDTNEELGREAVSILLNAINRKNSEPQHVKKEVSLFERNTTLPLFVEQPHASNKA